MASSPPLFIGELKSINGVIITFDILSISPPHLNRPDLPIEIKYSIISCNLYGSREDVEKNLKNNIFDGNLTIKVNNIEMQIGKVRAAFYSDLIDQKRIYIYQDKASNMPTIFFKGETETK